MSGQESELIVAFVFLVCVRLIGRSVTRKLEQDCKASGRKGQQVLMIITTMIFGMSMSMGADLRVDLCCDLR